MDESEHVTADCAGRPATGHRRRTYDSTFEQIENLNAGGVLHRSEYVRLKTHPDTAERMADLGKIAQA